MSPFGAGGLMKYSGFNYGRSAHGGVSRSGANPFHTAAWKHRISSWPVWQCVLKAVASKRPAANTARIDPMSRLGPIE